jgi:arylsulfate sulfotransferase
VRVFRLTVVLAVSGVVVACGPLKADLPPTVSIAATQHPLVASYSLTSSCPGFFMVEFGADISYGRSTAWYPTRGNHETNAILVAGMKASSTYHMHSILQCAGNTFTSDDQTFNTGPLPPSTPFPSLAVTRPSSAAPESDGIESVNIFAPGNNTMQSFFIDRDGNPIWYYDVGFDQGNAPYTMELLPNGHMIFSITRSVTAGTIIREVDLAGKTIREMDTGVLDQKMQKAGMSFTPTGFHHDLLPLSNGHLIVLVNFFQSFTDVQGYPGSTQVLGDGLVDLDQNWDPVWAWSSFDHLDVNRHPNGLPDWTHSNAVIYSPADGNLILSMRHQSWVMKIDYRNGIGNGDVLWKLGYQGDFSLREGDDPSLWFYYQHFPSLVSQDGQQTTLTVWDNGDNRVLDSSGTPCTTTCYSRATLFKLDESTRVADLAWQDLPGLFSIWGGSINQLPNGNVEFDANAPGPPPAPNVASRIEEVSQTADPQVVWQLDISPAPFYAYRAYRVPSLYPGITWQK